MWIIPPQRMKNNITIIASKASEGHRKTLKNDVARFQPSKIVLSNHIEKLQKIFAKAWTKVPKAQMSTNTERVCGTLLKIMSSQECQAEQQITIFVTNKANASKEHFGQVIKRAQATQARHEKRVLKQEEYFKK